MQFDSICIDSREVREQALFCAVSGEHADGHTYITDALARGATVIVSEHPLDHYDEHITYLMSSDIRATLSQISAWFYRTPENPVSVIGVTGTDGKSSTCYMLYQLLQAAGVRASLLSTVFYDDLGGLRENHSRMTTLKLLWYIVFSMIPGRMGLRSLSSKLLPMHSPYGPADSGMSPSPLRSVRPSRSIILISTRPHQSM